MLKRTVGVLALVLAGCRTPDSGRPDADANAGDARVTDVTADAITPVDAREPDAASPDAVTVDTAPMDVLAPIDRVVADDRADAVVIDTMAADTSDVRIAPDVRDVATDTPVTPITYVATTRTITSSGGSRTFVLARPTPMPPGALSLVFSLHGDGGNGTSMRTALPLEARAMGAAVFVYPNAPGGSFEYWTYDGRTREAQFVRDVIELLVTEIGIDRGRVFLTGFSGGATMSNALSCRLGPSVIHGSGIHSGTLYPTNDAMGAPDFMYTGSGGVSCSLPPTLFVWGQNDTTSGVSFTQGQGVRENYRATQSCASTSTAWTTAPCISYDACSSAVIWCPIPGMAHSIWSGAAGAMWSFFNGLP